MSMEFSDFYRIAEYGNDNWKGNFSPYEIACNAYDYLCEFQTSKENETLTEIIKTLCSLLAEDGFDDCKVWLREIAEELNLIDMDWHDYLETDNWLKEFIQ